jgi:predicted ATPase
MIGSGCSPVAAERPAPYVTEGIANLVAKSLIARDGSAISGRWRLLETIRAYALEKLGESGEFQRLARRHAEFYLLLFTEGQLPAVIDDLGRYRREVVSSPFWA